MSDTAAYTTAPPPTPAPLPRLEEVLARYEVLGEAGRGGMGVVYKARHRHLDRLVAVKVCLPGGQLDRFRREARLLAQLRSPHVVPVHDFDLLDDGRGVLVMEWVDGTDLRAVLARRGGRVPEEAAGPWMTQVCDGMAAAEERRIVHRDLKPSNILIDGRTNRALVADFGLAWSPGADQLSLPGQLMGTPYYMAPEQAEDSRRVDTRADVYSFGATFYHALTGHPPFDGPSSFAILFKHKTEPLTPPRAVNPAISVRAAQCLERCLAKSPAERFGSFAELRAALTPGATGSPWEPADDAWLDPYRARRPYYLAMAPVAGAGPDVYAFPDDRRLVIGFGDLTRHRVTAVVNSVSGLMHLDVGVARAISRAGGPAVAAWAAALAPVRAGRVVVTPAGDLPARFVFHGVTIGWVRGVITGPSRDLITEIVDGCFDHADTLDVTSIAFPLLGTGGAGGRADEALDAMVRSLARKMRHGVTSVREVRIVLYPTHLPPEQVAAAGEWL